MINSSNLHRIIDFDITNISSLLGLTIDKNCVIDILSKLGYKIINENNNILKLKIPTWRNDITIKENIIEDIIRIYGYDNLNEDKISTLKINDENEIDKKRNFISNKLWETSLLLSSQGMIEIVTWSFMDENLVNDFTDINDSLKICNPILKSFSYMRPTLIPNLLTAIKYNQDRSIENISFFEKGNVFFGLKEDEQKKVVCGVRTGLTCEKDIFNSSRNFDIYDVKKDLLDVIKLFGVSEDALKIDYDFPKYYHPARSATLKLKNKIIGVFGEIHPSIIKKFDIKNRVNAFEFYLENLPEFKINTKTQKDRIIFNDFQPIYRDFSFIIDNDIKIGSIVDEVKNIDKNLITDVHIFDIYQNNVFDKNKKSVAFTIKIQPIDRNLDKEDIDALSDKIIENISKQFNGILRKEEK